MVEGETQHAPGPNPGVSLRQRNGGIRDSTIEEVGHRVTNGQAMSQRRMDATGSEWRHHARRIADQRDPAVFGWAQETAARDWPGAQASPPKPAPVTMQSYGVGPSGIVAPMMRKPTAVPGQAKGPR